MNSLYKVHACFIIHCIFTVYLHCTCQFECIDLVNGEKHQLINCNLPLVPGVPEGGLQTVHSGHPDGLDPPGAWEGFVRNTLPEQTKTQVSVHKLCLFLHIKVIVHTSHNNV